MKRWKVALVAAALVALGVMLWEALSIAFFLIMLPVECDEMSDLESFNRRGDDVAEYTKACTAIGTFFDYAIVLQRNEAEKSTTLVEHGELSYGYPKFHWIDDDSLRIDLGRLRWIQNKIYRVGPISITYIYSRAE
jgi:hypothetical protein